MTDKFQFTGINEVVDESQIPVAIAGPKLNSGMPFALALSRPWGQDGCGPDVLGFDENGSLPIEVVLQDGSRISFATLEKMLGGSVKTFMDGNMPGIWYASEDDIHWWFEDCNLPKGGQFKGIIAPSEDDFISQMDAIKAAKTLCEIV